MITDFIYWGFVPFVLFFSVYTVYNILEKTMGRYYVTKFRVLVTLGTICTIAFIIVFILSFFIGEPL